jgi:hypothetical protein
VVLADVGVPVVAFLLVWVGATLVIDACLRSRHRPDLAERLRPYQPGSLAGTLGEQAEDWLDRQR